MQEIGIVGWQNDAKTHFGASNTYLEFISEFGTPKILMPGEKFKPVDLLILPGGLDINPASYGKAPRFSTTNTDVYKQYFYDNCLKDYIDAKVPILGICLGAQQLAVYFNSKLEQDLKFHAQSKDRWETAHEIFPINGGKVFTTEPIKVNSHHHQGLLMSKLGAALIPLFVSKNEENEADAIVEVFKHRDLPIYGVQYHPEELYDEVSIQIIKSLL